MTIKTSINFDIIRTAHIGFGAPMFFLDDIKETYRLTDEDCGAVVDKFGMLIADEKRAWCVSFDGFRALVALSLYAVGGDPEQLRRYEELMAE